MDVFSIRLKELRERAGMSQAQLARKLQVGQSTVGMWENGKNKPQNAKLEMLANIFGVSVDYILGRDQKPEPPSDVVRIPVLGTIQAGIPIEAIEEVLDWEEAPADWARGGAEYFALEIHGDSMNPAYIDGDVVIFRRQEDCNSGDDCAVMVNGDDATFKRVRLTERGMTLQALNPEFESLFFTANEVRDLPVRILGIAVELRRKFNR